MKVGQRQALEIIELVLANAGTDGLSINMKFMYLTVEKDMLENGMRFFKTVMIPLCSDNREVDIYDKEVWEALTPAEQAEAMNEMTSDYERYKQDKDARAAAAENETVVESAATEPVGIAQPA